MRLLGAILAGGQSRRFGSDKAMALLDGKPLIERAMEALIPQVELVIVCGREWMGKDWVADRPVPGLGPLGGINAALRYATDRGFDAVLTAPCDTPFLPPDIGRYLTDAGPTVFLEDMPVIGLWPAALAPSLDAYLAETSDRSVRGWARHVAALPYISDESPPNVNNLDDLIRISGLFP